MLSELTLSWIASILKISIYSKSLLCPQRHVYIAGEEATDERSWWSYKPTPDQFSLPHHYQPVICFRVYRHIIYECRYDIYNSTTVGVVTFFFFHTIGSSLHSHAYLKLTVWMIFKIKNENLWMVLLKKFWCLGAWRGAPRHLLSPKSEQKTQNCTKVRSIFH